VYQNGRNWFIRDGNGNTLRDVGSPGWPGAFSNRQQAEATIATLGSRLTSIAGSPVWYEVWSGQFVGYNGGVRVTAPTLEEFLQLYRIGT